MSAAPDLLEEMIPLTAQSLVQMETSDHFRVLKLLGEGSYGTVMLALHRKRGTPMALKMFPRASTSLWSFLREYHVSLSCCSHPSLCRALGIVYSTPSHYVFAQQAGLHGDLYDIITPEVGVGEAACQRVASQLCGALSHLHSLGFVHRDVKPENVFLCDSACRHVQLGDFGMVKPTGSRVPEVWYSSAYCPPEAEVARGNEDSWSSGKDGVTDEEEEEEEEKEVRRRRGRRKGRVWVSVVPAVDSWALGVLVYALLTGTQPWAETASDCPAFLKYHDWILESRGKLGEDLIEDGRRPRAPQFSCFTPLACALFHCLLHPRPQHRGPPQDALRFLGGAWKEEGGAGMREEEGRACMREEEGGACMREEEGGKTKKEKKSGAVREGE